MACTCINCSHLFYSGLIERPMNMTVETGLQVTFTCTYRSLESPQNNTNINFIPLPPNSALSVHSIDEFTRQGTLSFLATADHPVVSTGYECIVSVMINSVTPITSEPATLIISCKYMIMNTIDVILVHESFWCCYFNSFGNFFWWIQRRPPNVWCISYNVLMFQLDAVVIPSALKMTGHLATPSVGKLYIWHSNVHKLKEFFQIVVSTYTKSYYDTYYCLAVTHL